jgi:hypothetical protein
MHGTEGVRFYTRLKTITSRWPGGQDGVGGISRRSEQKDGYDEAGGFAMPTPGS